MTPWPGWAITINTHACLWGILPRSGPIERPYSSGMVRDLQKGSSVWVEYSDGEVPSLDQTTSMIEDDD